MGGQAVAMVRTEGASVSHDRLLTAGGYRRTHAQHLPPAPAEVAAARREDQRTAACALGPEAESARRARDFTRSTLRDWGMPELSDVAELVVSELVTNSLRHGLLSARWMPGEHPVGLTLLLRPPYLVCIVTDPESAGPVRIESCTGAESGRGLHVVESCSTRWGWQLSDGTGKVVWALLLAELRRTAGPARTGGRLESAGYRRARGLCAAVGLPGPRAPADALPRS